MSILCNASGEAFQLSGKGLPSTAQFTLMGWFNITSINAWGGLFFRGNASTEWLCATSYDTYVDIWISTANYGTIPISLNTWFHCAVTKNSANNHRTYINGALDINVTQTPAYTNTLLWLGCDPAYPGQYLNGEFCAFKAWNRRLNLAEVRREMYYYDAVDEAQLHGVWPLRSIADRRDYSGRSGFIGELAGSPTDGTRMGPPVTWCRQWRKRRVLFVPGGAAVALSGTSTVTSGTTGVLIRTVAHAGTSTVTSGTTGALAVARPLSSTVTVTSGTTGAIIRTKALSSTVTVTSGTTGALIRTKALASTSTVTSGTTGTLARTRALASTVDVTATCTGALTIVGEVPLSGASAATTDTTGTLVTSVPLSGTSAATTNTTGVLSIAGEVALSGTSAATCGATGTLNLVKALSGTSAATSGTTGILVTGVPLAGTSAVTSGTIGILTVEVAVVALSGTSAVTSDTTGALIRQLALASAVDCQSGTVAELTRWLALQGSVAAQSLVTGALAGFFEASVRHIWIARPNRPRWEAKQQLEWDAKQQLEWEAKQ